MTILVNATNLSGGGGVQVADSFCRYLNEYDRHHFIVVLSSALSRTAITIGEYKNVEVIRYNYPAADIYSLITKRNAFLDNIVAINNVSCVLTIFGPMKWKPKCAHVCGFALAHVVSFESPFYTRMPLIRYIKERLRSSFWAYIFRRSAEYFYTENSLISLQLRNKFKCKKVYTITNTYNQIFADKDHWNWFYLPKFDGLQLLTVSSMGEHKNLQIAIEVAKILKKEHPSFRFRFVLTITREEFPQLPHELTECFYFTGKVDISQCPSLYEQCDVEFQPTLLECFTATYPEAMIMRKPIITTNLGFARAICGEAAVYYEPLSPKSAADAIFTIASNAVLQEKLKDLGSIQITKFDNGHDRARKIIELCEEAASMN